MSKKDKVLRTGLDRKLLRPKSKLPRDHSKYSVDLCDSILRGIREDVPLSKLLKIHGISAETWYRWLMQYPDLAQQYRLAREYQSILWEERIVKCAEEAASHTVEDKRDNAYVQAKRLEIDALKWLMSKRLPQRYGDRMQVEDSGADRLTDVLSKALDRASRAVAGNDADSADQTVDVQGNVSCEDDDPLLLPATVSNDMQE